MRRSTLVLWLAFGLAAILAISWFAWDTWFSPLVLVTPTGTHVRAERSWGYIRRVSFDEDGDGRPEMVSIYATKVREIPTHTQPSESMIDEGGQGTFNLFIYYEPGAGAVRVRLDADRDGVFETNLSGEQARIFERDWRQSHRFGVTKETE